MIIIDWFARLDAWLARQAAQLPPRLTGPTHPPRPEPLEQPWTLDVEALRGVIRLGDDTPSNIRSIR